MSTPKSEVTAARILDAALALFREQGFDETTMRDIAKRAGVATGAAYYYYASKEAIVMDFYRRSYDAMQDHIRTQVESAAKFESALYELIHAKLRAFEPNRGILRALLRNGADPKYPLSPFSEETRDIRDQDIGWFARTLEVSGIRTPRDLSRHLPRVLWFFQMGVILFWVTDDSPSQQRTGRLLPLACKMMASLIRLSSVPLMRPLRKPVIELIEIVMEPEQ